MKSYEGNLKNRSILKRVSDGNPGFINVIAGLENI